MKIALCCTTGQGVPIGALSVGGVLLGVGYFIVYTKNNFLVMA